MPRSFFITPLVCATNPETGDLECGPKLNATQVNFTSVCQKRTVENPQCLALAAGDTSGAAADNQLVNLVADNLDTTVASLPNNVRNRIQNGLNSKNVPLTLNEYATVRDFLQALGEHFSAPNGFDLNNFWVIGE